MCKPFCESLSKFAPYMDWQNHSRASRIDNRCVRQRSVNAIDLKTMNPDIFINLGAFAPV